MEHWAAKIGDLSDHNNDAKGGHVGQSSCKRENT